MADYLSRACRLQLTTAMENLIRTAVFEISQIFEDSLHDHQVELARKGEEIAYLKIKLQRAELRLREVSTGSGAEQSLNQSFESPRTYEEPAPPHSSSAPAEDFEFEVPDDWCIPLDSENVNKPENPCPSVRLRQFSIPLFPIPLKHEAFSRLEISRLRHRHKDTAQTGSQEETKPKRKRGRPRVLKKEQVKDVLLKVKEESFDISVVPLKRGPGRPPKRHKIRKFESTNMNETQAGPSGNIYICRFCPKVFDTAFGLSVHDRAHKKCRGCKRIFPFPSVLAQHKPKCKYYKNLRSSSVSTKETISKEKSSNIEQLNKPRIKLSDRKICRFTCKCCQKKFDNRSTLLKHPCFITCQMCRKRLSSRMALAVHMTKMHNSHKGLTEGKIDTSWTKPLVKMRESQVQDLSPFDRAKGHIKQCSLGFKCLICKRVYASKHTAVEHIFQHIGEKPFKCTLCPQAFSQRNYLSVHRRKLHGVVLRKVIKCACSKRFFIKSKYKEHKLSCPKAGK